MVAPNNNRGMTYQTDWNHKSKIIGYLVGVVKLAFYSLNTRLLLHVFTNNLLKYLYQIRHRKTRKMLRLRVFGPPRLAPYRLGHGVRTLLMPYHF